MQPFQPMSLSAQPVPHHHIQDCEHIKSDSRPEGLHLDL